MENTKKATKIVVWDYYDVLHGHHYAGQKPSDNPKRLDVHAHCVGGAEGVLAFFEYDKWFCGACGDDGHWYLMYRCGLNWKERIIDAINLM